MKLLLGIVGLSAVLVAVLVLTNQHSTSNQPVPESAAVPDPAQTSISKSDANPLAAVKPVGQPAPSTHSNAGSAVATQPTDTQNSVVSAKRVPPSVRAPGAAFAPGVGGNTVVQNPMQPLPLSALKNVDPKLLGSALAANHQAEVDFLRDTIGLNDDEISRVNAIQNGYAQQMVDAAHLQDGARMSALMNEKALELQKTIGAQNYAQFQQFQTQQAEQMKRSLVSNRPIPSGSPAKAPVPTSSTK